MAGNIKGITIEFRGETTSLDKAIRNINKETRSLDRELKQVDKALKFNPTNVDLWRQKQTILTQKIDDTKEKLDLLKQEQKQMDADGVDKNSDKYRKLQREIIETESKLKNFEAQQRKIGQVNLRAASEQFKEIGSKLTTAGQAMKGLSTAAAAVATSIGALTVKSAKWADDVVTSSKVYSMSTKELQKYQAAADLVDVSADAIAKTHRKLERNMLNAQLGSKKQALAFKELGISYENADGTLRDGDEVWQDTIEALSKMENETERDAYAMALMGRSATELNPLIEDGAEGYKLLTDAMQKYDLEFVDEETLQRANDFNDLLDVMKNVGLIAFQQMGTQLAAYLAPAMEKVVDLVGKLANWFSNLSPRTQAIIAGIAAVVAVIAPLLLGLGKISFAVSSILSLMATVGPAIMGVISTLGPVILIIGAVVAAGILLYKNWDEIKEKALELKDKVILAFNNLKSKLITAWNNIKAAAVKAWATIKMAVTRPITNAVSTIKTKINSLKSTLSGAWATIKATASSAWNSIKGKITGPFQKAKEIIDGVVSKISGMFPISIGNIFSNVKTPHFNISWETLGETKLKIPKFNGISWYKTGGIFDNPSVIGVGEAGPEAVVPLNTLWDKLDNIAAASGSAPIVINVYGSPNMSVNELAAAVEQKIIQAQKRRSLAWQ